MKLVKYRLTPDTRRAGLDAALANGASWAQFGQDLLVFAGETPPAALVEHAERRAAQIEVHPQDVRREHLHVVVQNGRLFQQQHPDVPVLIDRGRFLLVDLAPERARGLNDKEATCYGVLPLTDGQVVFDVRVPSAARPAPVPWVQHLVNKVSRARLEADLTQLVSFPTRHSISTHYAAAASWARKQLKALNYTTRTQSVVVGDDASRNVIADKRGGGGTRSLVLVTAHLDSVNLQGGLAASAPGADDNGSGSAGLLEMARVFRDHPSVHDLRFVLFGGEEQGLFGSSRYVATLSAGERARIRAVINMDMIGSLNSASRSVLLEGAPVSQAVIDGLSEAAATYTDLTVETSLNPFASDHVPFIRVGIPALLTIEGADNANGNIHSSNDTIDRIDYDLAVEILRMNVAFVGQALGKTEVG